MWPTREKSEGGDTLSGYLISLSKSGTGIKSQSQKLQGKGYGTVSPESDRRALSRGLAGAVLGSAQEGPRDTEEILGIRVEPKVT